MANAWLAAIVYQDAFQLQSVSICLHYTSTSRHLVRQYLSNLQANRSDVVILHRAENHLPWSVPFLGEEYLPHQPPNLLLGESIWIPGCAPLPGKGFLRCGLGLLSE